MIKKLSKSVLVAMLSLSTLAACNTSDNVPEMAEPSDVNYNPAPVSYGPGLGNNGLNTDATNQQNRMYMKKFEYRYEIPNANGIPHANKEKPNQTYKTPKTDQNKTAQPKPETTQPEQQAPTTSPGLTDFQQQVIDLTNKERQKNGLSPLQADSALGKAAQAKSDDMSKNNYFSHTSPTYGSPFEMLKSFGIDYRTAAENIAAGQQSPQEVVNAWMNSAGHRANILNQNVTHIGVGHAQSGNYWTQLFIGK